MSFEIGIHLYLFISGALGALKSHNIFIMWTAPLPPHRQLKERKYATDYTILCVTFC